MADLTTSNNNVDPHLKTGPVSRGSIPVASDSLDLPVDGRGLYVGVTGNVKIRTPANVDITFVALAAGVIHPIEVRRVFSTGTTATDLLVLY